MVEISATYKGSGSLISGKAYTLQVEQEHTNPIMPTFGARPMTVRTEDTEMEYRSIEDFLAEWDNIHTLPTRNSRTMVINTVDLPSKGTFYPASDTKGKETKKG